MSAVKSDLFARVRIIRRRSRIKSHIIPNDPNYEEVELDEDHVVMIIICGKVLAKQSFKGERIS